MAIIKIDRFYGTAPRYGARKLGVGQSQVARNVDLFSNELKPIKRHIDVSQPSKTGIPLSIFPLGDLWLHWDSDVDVVRAPIETDTTGRIYYTGDYNPKSTNIDLATVGSGTDYPLAFYRLGVPRPDAAPTVTMGGGGSGNSIDRTYLFTFVTAWGEEGPPSPGVTQTGKIDDTWTVTALPATPPNSGTISTAVAGASKVTLTFAAAHYLETGDYIVVAGTIVGSGDIVTDIVGTWEFTRTSTVAGTIVLTTTGTYTSGGTWEREAPLQTTGWLKRVYRSLGGSYYYVGETTSTSLADTVADEDLAELMPFGDLENEWWKGPPPDLQGLTMAINGIIVGFVNNTVYMSEPYVPNAFPRKYRITVDYQIVGLGVIGNTIVVATTGNPYVIVGDSPDNMIDRKLNISQSCMSKRGIVSASNGVIYPSPNGLVYVPAAGNPIVITQNYVKKKEWDLFAPASIHGHLFQDRYYGFYTDGGEDGDESGAVIFDPQEPDNAFTTLGIVTTAGYSDEEHGSLYLVQDGVVTQHEGGGTFLVYTWKSKKFTVLRPACIKAGKVKLEQVESSSTATTLGGALDALESSLANTALDVAFGADNNYYQGGFGGYDIGRYAVAGGPYHNALSDTVSYAATAILKLYAEIEDSNGDMVSTLVATKNLVDSKPFRLPGGYRSDTFEVEINSNSMHISEVMLSSTMTELAEG